jgi:hypothetical protein
MTFPAMLRTPSPFIPLCYPLQSNYTLTVIRVLHCGSHPSGTCLASDVSGSLPSSFAPRERCLWTLVSPRFTHPSASFLLPLSVTISSCDNNNHSMLLVADLYPVPTCGTNGQMPYPTLTVNLEAHVITLWYLLALYIMLWKEIT